MTVPATIHLRAVHQAGAFDGACSLACGLPLRDHLTSLHVLGVFKHLRVLIEVTERDGSIHDIDICVPRAAPGEQCVVRCKWFGADALREIAQNLWSLGRVCLIEDYPGAMRGKPPLLLPLRYALRCSAGLEDRHPEEDDG